MLVDSVAAKWKQSLERVICAQQLTDAQLQQLQTFVDIQGRADSEQVLKDSVIRCLERGGQCTKTTVASVQQWRGC